MMSERQVTILNRKGLHVRPAAAFAEEAADALARFVDSRFGMEEAD